MFHMCYLISHHNSFLVFDGMFSLEEVISKGNIVAVIKCF